LNTVITGLDPVIQATADGLPDQAGQ